MNRTAIFVVGVLRIARAVLFVIGITVPLVGYVLHWQGSGQLDSKAAQKQLPRLGTRPAQWGAYMLAFRAYFNENFGLRKDMIRLHAIAKFQLFGVASNEKVLLGKHGWFYMGKYFDSIEYCRNIRPFTSTELENWKVVLERRRDSLRARGIQYLFVIAPNKESVYPEYLPEWYTRVNRRSRLDQLLAYMSENSDMKIVDLRPALRGAKGGVPVFYKTDSHWNSLGACFACESLLQAIRETFPQIQPFAAAQFRVERKLGMYHGDLLHLSGLGDLLGEDEILVHPPRAARATAATLAEGVAERGKLPRFATECDSISAPRAVIFRDSFFMALQPFVAEHFRRAVYVWQNEFEMDVVNREPCDIVIQEVVERSLIWPPPADSFDED